jgi:hypothetical protein
MESEYRVSLPTSDMRSSKLTLGYIQRRTDNNKQQIHSKCSLTFTPPVMDLLLPKRWCNPNDERRYSDSWDDAEVEAQCEAFTAVLCSGSKAYRNRHCLLCNKLDILTPCYCYSIYYTGQQRFWPMRKYICFWCIFGRWIRICFQNFSITHIVCVASDYVTAHANICESLAACRR